MLISEIFHSLQGEGELTGVPSVFIRTAGCNLRCSWCDTKYSSWTPEGVETSLEEIMQKVQSYPAQHVVLTGGEPMIAKGIHALADRLRRAGKHITIETAGTVAPDGIVCDLASLSPKLSNSTPDQAEIGAAWQERHESTRWQPEILRIWLEKYPYQLKFVLSQGEQAIELQRLLTEIHWPIPSAKVLLMPEGTNPETLRESSVRLIEVCKEHGYRYCTRLHIDLFGNTKGT